MTSGGSSGGDFLGQGRGAFLLDLEACLNHWRGAISRGARPNEQEGAMLRRVSLDLSSRARGIGFGGIGHHLGSLLTQFEASAPPAALSETLETVAHMAGQARFELAPAELAVMQRAAGGNAPRGGGSDPAPPPMMTIAGRRGSGSPGAGFGRGGPESVRPPQLIDSGIVAHGHGGATPPPPLQPLAPLGGGGSAPPLPGLGQPLMQAPPALVLGQQLPPPAPPNIAGPPGPPVPPPMFSGSNLGQPAAAPVPAPQAVFEVAPPPASRPGGAPNLLVRSMLGLRAFGRGGGAKAEAPAPIVAPQPPPEAPGGGLLGLGSGRRDIGNSSVARPPRLDHLPSGLPPLAPQGPGQSHKSGPVPQVRSKSKSSSQSGRMQQLLGDLSHGRDTPHKGVARRGGRSARLRDRHESGSWVTGALIGLGVLVVLGGLATLVVVLTRKPPPTVATSNSGPTPTVSNTPELPTVKLTTDNERLRSLLTQVHGRGKESPELRALVDEHAALAARALNSKCSGPSCAEIERLRKSIQAANAKHIIRKRDRSSAEKLRSPWLVGLKMPEIPVEDDPRVARQFQFYTENTVGRETFQGMLFRCGSYRDMIQSTLIRYGLPADLWAVVFAESSCEPRAQSQVGASGLWQFIPSAARAYHLRVIDDVVDERLNPPKSTEAGVRYLRDMYEKLGEWDLVFASYNMGPFALMTRIEQAGGDVGFWDLVDAEMLPDETANYAPAIQAIALILNNVQRLKFSTQTRPPQLTSDLTVPPGTRLTLVARAAATSVAQLHALNLDIMGESTPNVPDFAIQVPKDVVWQARDTLKDLLTRHDDGDLCVPSGFDWGRQRFTEEMAEACRRRNPSGVPSAIAP